MRVKLTEPLNLLALQHDSLINIVVFDISRLFKYTIGFKQLVKGTEKSGFLGSSGIVLGL